MASSSSWLRYTEGYQQRVRLVDGVYYFALGAVALEWPLAGRGLAVARFVTFEERPDVAEAAFSVVDAVQGKGLGRLLLAHLAEAARERGVRRFECNVLPSNLCVRRLLAPLRPTCRVELDGTLLFDAPLAPAAVHQVEGAPACA